MSGRGAVPVEWRVSAPGAEFIITAPPGTLVPGGAVSFAGDTIHVMQAGCLHLDDAALLRAFLGRTLTHSQWDHSAHLRVAWMHIREHGCDQAIVLLRDRINALNASHNVPDLPTRGYHETITIAWVRVIASRLAEDHDSLAFLERNHDLLNPLLLQASYTTERLMSSEAKARFVAPDLGPLPTSKYS